MVQKDDDVLKKLSDHEERISALEKLLKSEHKVVPKSISIKEFILQKHPKTEVGRTLVIGYYLEHYRNVTPFNAKDLERGFREAKETIPKNINLAVIGCIERGHMMEAESKKDKKKAWTLTGTGEGFVEGGLKETDLGG